MEDKMHYYKVYDVEDLKKVVSMWIDDKLLDKRFFFNESKISKKQIIDLCFFNDVIVFFDVHQENISSFRYAGFLHEVDEG